MSTYTTRTEIRAHRNPWAIDAIAIRIARITAFDGTRKVAIAGPLEFKTLSEDEVYLEHPAALDLRPDEAQQFMDELWRVGIRPTDGAGSVGQLAATTKHLEDMRVIAFKSLETPKP